MKSGRLMIGLVLMLLFTGVGANVYLVFAASRDPSFAVEPGYYEKAVRWDETQAERARSAELGWRAEARFEGSELRIRLTTDEGLAIEDAAVELEVFHNARSKERRLGSAPCVHGAYVFAGAFERTGFWIVRIRASRGSAIFVDELEVARS